MALLQIKVGDDFIEVPAIKGSDGKDFTILGQYATIEDLELAHPTGTVGDYWAVGDANYSDLYIWDSVTNAWVDIGQVGINLNANFVFITDSGSHFTSNEVEGALQEIGSSLVGKAPISHTHAISDITDLLASLNAKATVWNTTLTLPSASWTGSSAPYTKVVALTGILATDKPIIGIEPSGTYATDVTMRNNWNLIYDVDTANNSLTFYADSVPSADIPLKLTVVR